MVYSTQTRATMCGRTAKSIDMHRSDRPIGVGGEHMHVDI